MACSVNVAMISFKSAKYIVAWMLHVFSIKTRVHLQYIHLMVLFANKRINHAKESHDVWVLLDNLVRRICLILLRFVVVFSHEQLLNTTCYNRNIVVGSLASLLLLDVSLAILRNQTVFSFYSWILSQSLQTSNDRKVIILPLSVPSVSFQKDKKSHGSHESIMHSEFIESVAEVLI